MDPKQTPPLGNAQTSGQEGQPVGAPTSGATSGVFKMAGDLGAENLSTGANVSRTMDSLNNANQSATGAPVFAKHKFDKIEYATGDIIVDNNDAKPKSSFFGFFGSSKKNGPKVKSAAEITREARREAKRLRKLNAGKGNGSMVEPASAATAAQPVPAPAASTPTPTPAPTSASKPQTTKRTKLIVGALVAILIIAASILGIVALTSNKKTNTKPNNTSVVISEEAIKEAFSDYLSYLLWGNEGYNTVKDAWTECVKNNCIDLNAESAYATEIEKLIKSAKDEEDYFEIAWKLHDRNIFPFYAERKMAEPTSSQRTTYFEELDNKWNDFLDIYSGAIRETPRQFDVSRFFYDMAMIGNLNEKDVIEIYKRNKADITNDKNPAADEILTKFSVQSDDPAVISYFDWKRNYLLEYLSFVKNADEAGCLNDELTFTCDIQTVSGYQKYLDALMSTDIDYLKKNNAVAALRTIQQELFTDAENDEGDYDE